MCGITGISTKENNINIEKLWLATDILAHRGPDDRGIYVSQNQRNGMGHRRLSFIDISPSGKQPMSNKNGSLHITFNGEIYNYKELRTRLENDGIQFETHTDTEVLLNGYKKWGTSLPNYLDGMFAFAILDEEEQTWFLCRDRFGIKPLFFSFSNDAFIFGSEIKSLLAFEVINKKIRPDAISLFLANRYIPCPFTIWDNIYQVRPGHYLEINLQQWKQKNTAYWILETGNLYEDSETARNTFENMFQQSVQSHLIADVPVGSFLSGGYDSSALVYIMQKVLHYPTKAFTIGFKDWAQSEDKYASIVAESTGADLYTSIADESHLSMTHKLMWHYDNPIADISIIPTYEVSRLASSYVKAVLSGEGADEALGGYWWHKSENWLRYSSLHSRLFGYSFTDIKKHYISAMSMGLFDNKELKKCLTSTYASHIPDDPFSHFDTFRLPNETSIVKQIQYLDIYTFMSDLILTKIDRASMAHSLEVRVPFLQHQLIQYLFSLSSDVVIKKNIQKYFLHDWLKTRLPATILNRSKQGFVGPDAYYMNIDIYQSALKNGELIKQGVIQKAYMLHLIKTKDHWRLWKMYALENWWKVWQPQ